MQVLKVNKYIYYLLILYGLQLALVVKNLLASARDIRDTKVRSLGQEEDSWRRA